jgi:hypothetical protein
MNKKFLLILSVSLVLLLAVWIYTLRSNQGLSEVEPTAEEVMREVGQTETPEEAGELVIEKIDEEFSTSGEADFNPDDLSDEALGL